MPSGSARAGAAPTAPESQATDRAAAAPPRRRLLRLAPALAGLGLFAGCGFQLRRPVVLPFRRLALSGFSPDMERALRVAAGPAIEWMAAPAQAEVQLVALTSTREKSVASYTATRRVSELQLRARLRYRVQTPAGRLLLPDTELLLTRELSYSETYALGKEHEEARLYADMEADIALQVLRRLASARP
jgi:LPS-assembly lipoprotein